MLLKVRYNDQSICTLISHDIHTPQIHLTLSYYLSILNKQRSNLDQICQAIYFNNESSALLPPYYSTLSTFGCYKNQKLIWFLKKMI